MERTGVEPVTSSLQSALGLGFRTDESGHTRESGLGRATRDERNDRLELEALARCVLSDDGREGVAALLEKHAPTWRE
jgi:hypothetical protein